MYVWVYELINVLYLNLSWVLLSFQFLLRRTSKYSQKQFQKSKVGIGYIHRPTYGYTYKLYTYMEACTVNKIRTQSACRHRRGYIYVRIYIAAQINRCESFYFRMISKKFVKQSSSLKTNSIQL